MNPRGLALAAVLGLATPATAGDLPADEVRPRVEYHLRAAIELADHFEAVMRSGCPRFTTTSQWDAYVNGETDKVILLAAHMEQAWVEAKTTGDDEVRRTAKAPRRRMEEGRALVAMLSACAEANGTTLQTGALYRHIERELPRRQAEIALPPLPERP
jgi:hypothetical protein